MEVILAKPRGFCAGVVRAVEIVEAALETYGPPVYVLHEIVHNQHVVADLQTRGAIFVERLEDVPMGATTIFSAHGVATSIVNHAVDRKLSIVDATCPLVTKVHLEVERHARAGREVILIGHAGHPEVNGTLGQYDRQFGGDIYLVQTVADVEQLQVKNPHELAFVTQTTLSVEDTRRIIQALQQRYPNITGPRKNDICYATQNRQNAVRELSGKIDMLLVVGARNSSNSNRLREVGHQIGIPAYLLQDASELNESWLNADMRIGITAGASTPEILVQGVLEKLRRLGVNQVMEMDAEAEAVAFRLPESLNKAKARDAATVSRKTNCRETVY
jgi:4-hydroxy-3-methylbut-2-enyl diphosphate reductase